MNVQRVPDRSWDVQAVTNIQGAIERGDVLLLSCWLRCLETTSEDGQGRLRVHIQRNRAPHDKLLTLPVSVGLQWRQVVHPFRAAFDLPDGNSNIAFHLGLRQQRLLIADMRLVNYGSSKTVHELPTFVETYRGRSLDAALAHRC